MLVQRFPPFKNSSLCFVNATVEFRLLGGIVLCNQWIRDVEILELTSRGTLAYHSTDGSVALRKSIKC